METKENVDKIEKLQAYLENKSTELIMITYDSFLFDFDKRDGGKLIHIIKEELEQDKKYPTKIEVGPDYSNMITIKR